MIQVCTCAVVVEPDVDDETSRRCRCTLAPLPGDNVCGPCSLGYHLDSHGERVGNPPAKPIATASRRRAKASS